MPVPTSIDDLDTNEANNSPPGSESAKGTIDNYLRAHAAFIKQNNNKIVENQEFVEDLLGTDSSNKASARAVLGAMASDSSNISATAGGTANAITASFSPAITTITNSLTVYVIASAANTSTTPTFQANATAALTIVKGTGSALSVGDIPGAGYRMILQGDPANNRWILQNPASGVSVGLQTSGFVGYSATASMSSTDFGKFVYYNGGSAGTLSLPGVTSSKVGSVITVTNISSANCTINRSSTSEMLYVHGVAVTAVVLRTGDSITLATSGSDWWQVQAFKNTNAQTLQSVKASRVSGATYHNSTGLTIWVIVHATSAMGSSAAVSASVGSESLGTQYSTQQAGYTQNCVLTFPVPDDADYTVNVVGSITAWHELRKG